MHVNVGSSNPVKVNAVKNAFSRYFDCTVTGIEVVSGVGEMPIGDDMIIKGAISRAKQAIGSAEFGVGMEGGAVETHYGMFLTGWCAIIDRRGVVSLGNGGMMPLPDTVADKIRQGYELGPVMDMLSDTKDIKRKGGAIGFFTGGEIERTQSFEYSAIFALAPFIRKEVYDV